jgi:6-phosphogluconate dehydrogenase
MANSTKQVGILGLGSMGSNVAKRLLAKDYPLVIYNKASDKYEPFKGRRDIYLASDTRDFAKRLGDSGKEAIVWMMVPGGSVTNELVKELSTLLRKNDIVIDASNSVYTDSIANYNVLKQKGISYLDVGCAGGPDDLLNGVALMVGGDKVAFESAKDVFATVCGSGTYGYLGSSGSGHMAKLVHNTIFYGIFPVYSEGIEFLLKMKTENPSLDVDEALRLLAKSPPITTGIMDSISTTIKNGNLPAGEAPRMSISSIVESGAKRAGELGVSLSVTRAILAGYSTMSEASRKIYGAAKRKLTGH